MICDSSSIREKDVISTCDGRRLGYVCDFSIDCATGQLCAVYVSDRLFGFGGKNTLRIGWDKICCIGADTILVNVSAECAASCQPNEKGKRRRSGWLF